MLFTIRKSVGLVTLLALDPIPGDALLYSGKVGQAGLNMGIGAIGGFLFWGAFYASIDDPEPDTDISTGMMILGGMIYFPMLLWDGIGGARGVLDHNRAVEDQNKNSSLLSNIRPYMAFQRENTTVGFTLNF